MSGQLPRATITRKLEKESMYHKHCQPNHNIIQLTMCIGWGCDQPIYYLEINYDYFVSIASHMHIQVEITRVNQCTNII